MKTAAFTNQSNRILSIDFLRGFVMILMALDHVRDFFHNDAMMHDPLDLQTTTPFLYFTRWITHYCAPIFVFLSGISARISGARKTNAELSTFLWKRGLWLVMIEFSVVTFGWSFNPFFSVLVMQVIWAIGISMIALSLLIRLPNIWILIISLIILTGHNLLDFAEANRNGQVGLLWDLLHHGHFTFYPFAQEHAFVVVYPVLPWIGIMGLGFWMGRFFLQDFNAQERQRILLYTGSGMALLFIVLRMQNVYGDPIPWKMQSTGLLNVLSFINVTKYPPSLLFTCMTIGPALIFLSLSSSFTNAASKFVITFGRVPFFYYILHIYVIHLLTVVMFFVSGYTSADIMSKGAIFLFRPPAFGYPLSVVYLFWGLVILLCYFPCRWYDRYKTTHKQWWLSYL